MKTELINLPIPLHDASLSHFDQMTAPPIENQLSVKKDFIRGVVYNNTTCTR